MKTTRGAPTPHKRHCTGAAARTTLVAAFLRASRPPEEADGEDHVEGVKTCGVSHVAVGVGPCVWFCCVRVVVIVIDFAWRLLFQAVLSCGDFLVLAKT